MNKALVKLCSCFIFNKQKRREFRAQHKADHKPQSIHDMYGPMLKNINDNLNFIKNQELLAPLVKEEVGNKKTVLILEPNGCHSILLPSISYYFLSLGYNIHVATSSQNVALEPFCNCNFPKDRFKCFVINVSNVFYSLFIDILLKYDYIFLTTPMYGTSCNVLDHLLKEYVTACHKNNLLYLEHHLNRFAEHPELERFIDSHRVFMLNEFSLKNKKINELYLTYIGKIQQQPKNKKTTFISVGRQEPNVKDLLSMYDACRTLLNENYKNFHIILVGKVSESFFIPEDLKEYITITGPLSYPKMILELERSDFLLYLLNSQNKVHRRYKDECVSGSVALMYGANKPAIIEEEFASSYSLNNTNAIVYEENELWEGMKKAILMSSEQYKKLQRNLLHLKEVKEKNTIKYIEEALNVK